MTAINFVLDNLDFLVEIILFILIYQYITSEKIKLRWYIIIPLIIRFLFVLSPALSYVIGHAFLVVYSLYRNRYGNRLLDIFYGLFPIIIESLVHNLIIYGIALVINRHYLIVLNHFHLNLVIELLVFPVFWLIIKTLKVDFITHRYINVILCPPSPIYYLFCATEPWRKRLACLSRGDLCFTLSCDPCLYQCDLQ